MATSTEEGVPTKGTVKFFGASYGFFTDKNGVDAHVRSATLEKFGFTPRDVVRDTEVVYETKQRGDDLKVSAIISIGKKSALDYRSPKYQPPIVKAAFTDEDHGRAIIAKVDFYLVNKQYGFLQVIEPEGYADIFFHQKGVSDKTVKTQLNEGKILKGTLVTAVIGPSDEHEIGTKKPPIALVTGYYVPPEVPDESDDDLSEPKPLAELHFMSQSICG